jgi:hypothetical protein
MEKELDNKRPHRSILDSYGFGISEIYPYGFTYQNKFRFLLTALSEFEKIGFVFGQSQTIREAYRVYSGRQ